MSPRTWLLGQLGRILGSDELDSVALVELATVNSYEAPLISAVLARKGVLTKQIDFYDAILGINSARLMVAHGNIEAATTILADFRGR